MARPTASTALNAQFICLHRPVAAADRIIGHGVEGDGAYYCCAHCARSSGVAGVIDNADKGDVGDRESGGAL